MVKPEEYDEYGYIKQKIEISKPYTRALSAYEQDRIHETKDLYDSNCSYCVKRMKKYNNIKTTRLKGYT
jgi:hypothetical protein